MLAALALIPFVVMMATSFVKISVVLSIVKNALGTQQIPPAAVITGLSVVLTIYIMGPVGTRMYEDAKASFENRSKTFSAGSIDDLADAMEAGKGPLKNFLKNNAGEQELTMLAELAVKRWGSTTAVSPTDMIVLVPAFVLTQLREGFRIGFLIFVPFLVIDLVIVNVLLALGMGMLPPMTITMPLKILIFVMSDGWALLARGLVESFKG